MRPATAACHRVWSCRGEDTPDSTAARRKHVGLVRSAFCKAGGPDGAATDGDPGGARAAAGGGHRWRSCLVPGLRRVRGGYSGETAPLRDWRCHRSVGSLLSPAGGPSELRPIGFWRPTLAAVIDLDCSPTLHDLRLDSRSQLR